MNAVTETTNAQRGSVFSRVLVGIDGSEESREAARQAAILADGELTLLASYDVAPAIGGTGAGVPAYLDEDLQRDAATEALERAREDVALASPTGRIVRGRPADALISEVEREQNTLLVVGSHGLGRLAGFVMGSAATEVIHEAPCSVLIARRGSESVEFPNKVVVGVDGSPESAAAYVVHVNCPSASMRSYRPSSHTAVRPSTGRGSTRSWTAGARSCRMNLWPRSSPRRLAPTCSSSAAAASTG